jgi:FixJ family two-component response regulator
VIARVERLPIRETEMFAPVVTGMLTRQLRAQLGVLRK